MATKVDTTTLKAAYDKALKAAGMAGYHIHIDAGDAVNTALKYRLGGVEKIHRQEIHIPIGELTKEDCTNIAASLVDALREVGGLHLAS